LIGHGVVMESIRKMTVCLQTFGGHCIASLHYSVIKAMGSKQKLCLEKMVKRVTTDNALPFVKYFFCIGLNSGFCLLMVAHILKS